MIEVQIKQLMSKPAVTLKPSNTVGEAIKLMKEKGLGSIIIVDDDNMPYDIFTERDVLNALDSNSKINESMLLSQLQRKDHLIAIFETDSLDNAIKILADEVIHHLIVTDYKGIVTGIISTKDVIKAQQRFNKTFPYFPDQPQIIE